MYQLYQENIDQVWPSSANNCKEPLNFRAKSTKKEKSGRKKCCSTNATFWKTVFSDEAMLELNSKEKDLVRRPRKTHLNTRFSRKTIFPRKKSMVWGCIRSNGDGLLIPVKNKVDSDEYIKILKDHIDFLYMHEPFQQDNALAINNDFVLLI